MILLEKEREAEELRLIEEEKNIQEQIDKELKEYEERERQRIIEEEAALRK